MSEALTYSKIPPDRYEEVIELLRRSFFPHEPLNKSLSLCQSGESVPELEEFSRDVLKQDLSTMAVIGPDEKIVGAMLMGVSSGTNDSPNECINPKVEKIFNFLDDMVKDCKYGEGIEEKDIVDLKICGVDAEMRGKGIAKVLFSMSEKIAKDKGFKMMRGEATSLFSQIIMEKSGWKAIKEVKYSEYPSSQAPLFNVESPHDFFKVMVKRI